MPDLARVSSYGLLLVVSLWVDAVAAPSAESLSADVAAAYARAGTYRHGGHAEFTGVREDGTASCTTKKTFELYFIRDRGFLVDTTTDGDLWTEQCESGVQQHSVTWSDMECIRQYTKSRMLGRKQDWFVDCLPFDRFQFFERDIYWHSEQIVLDRLLGRTEDGRGEPPSVSVEDGSLPGGDAVWILVERDARGHVSRYFIDKDRHLIRRHEHFPAQAPDVMVRAISYDVVESDPALTDESITFEPPTLAALKTELITKPLRRMEVQLHRFGKVFEKHPRVWSLGVAFVLFAVGYSLTRWAPARFLPLKVALVALWTVFPLISVFAFEGMMFATFMLPLLFPLPPALAWGALGIALARNLRESETAKRRLTIAGSVMIVIYLLLWGLLMSGGVHF